MKKILILLVTLFFITGCSLIPSSSNKETPEESKNKFISGTEGVSLEVIYPTSKLPIVSDSSATFSPQVVVSNKGESSSEGEICVSGLDKNIFQGFNGCECQTYSLTGVTRGLDDNVFPGQEVQQTFTEYKINKELITTDVNKYALSFFNTFSFKTKSYIDLCIPSKGLTTQSSCSKSPKTDSSAAPIKLDSVEVNTRKINENEAEINLYLTIENKGSGSLASSISQGCLDKGETKTITINLDPNGIGTVTCNNIELNTQQDIKDFNSKGGDIHCKIKGVKLAEEEFTKTINIELDYYYQTTSSVNFEISTK